MPLLKVLTLSSALFLTLLLVQSSNAQPAAVRSVSTSNADNEKLVADYIEKSGLLLSAIAWQQTILDPQWMPPCNCPPGQSVRPVNVWQKLVFKHFEVQSVTRELGQEYGKKLSSSELKQSIAFWRTSAGTKAIANLKSLLKSNDNQAAQMMHLGSAKIKLQRDAKFAKFMRTYIGLVGGIEASADVLVDLSISIYSGFLDAQKPGFPKPAQSDIDEHIRAGRPQLIQVLAPMFLAQHAMLYQNLNEKEREQVLSFLSSPVGRKETLVGQLAVRNALWRRGRKIGFYYVKSLSRQSL